MKKLLVLGIGLLLAGCGYTARDGELIGQAKWLSYKTPIFCADYLAFGLSLGVMRDGTGSMSTRDVAFTLNRGVDLTALKQAVEGGRLVKVRYDVRRFAICTEDLMMNSVELVP